MSCEPCVWKLTLQPKPKHFKMLNFLTFFFWNGYEPYFLNFRVGSILRFKSRQPFHSKDQDILRGYSLDKSSWNFFQALVRWGTCQTWIVNTSDWLILGCQNTYFQLEQKLWPAMQCNYFYQNSKLGRRHLKLKARFEFI